MRFSALIQEDIDLVNKGAAWTEDQAAVFSRLLRGNLTDAGIMTELKISSTHFYRVKKEVVMKIERILSEKR